MSLSLRRRSSRQLVAVAASMIVLDVTGAAGAQAPLPPWREHLVPWESTAEDARPWRTDARLAGRSEPGYPDDFQVRFANPDSARGGVAEHMWVRVIAWDARTDRYLGILLNKPDLLPDLYENDNVVFAIDRGSGRLDAMGAPRYAAEGWPATPASRFTTALRDGIRAYRDGHDGHNMPGIERCIAVLQSAVDSEIARATADERFVGHFVLGRCLAEKYETERAIGQFRQAIALRPDDFDSHMALLAELTIVNHRRTPPATPAAAAEWERQFVAELSDIKGRFPNDPLVRRLLGYLFDASQLTAADSASTTERARLARIGYATFRWKRR